MTKENEWQKVEISPSWNGNDENKKFKLVAGDELVGTFQGFEEHVGENDSNVYTFKTADGIKSVWGSTVLDARFKNFEIGEQVKIVYLGKVKSEKRKGKEYHNYDVYHRKPTYEDIPVIDDSDTKSLQEKIDEA